MSVITQDVLVEKHTHKKKFYFCCAFKPLLLTTRARLHTLIDTYALSAPLQIWRSAPDVSPMCCFGCFSSCYCLFINQHLRRIDGVFFATSHSVPSKNTITGLSKMHPPVTPVISQSLQILIAYVCGSITPSVRRVQEWNFGLHSLAICYFINQM